MVKYNNMCFIGFEEEWKIIKYKDIKPNTYEVSNLGRFRKVKNKKILFGCNEENERGKYKRISLKSISGKNKKYPMHRIVLKTFGDYDENLEVNHINHKKYDNSVFNLNKMTRKENAEDAANFNLYQSGEKHYKSIFTDEEVHTICRLLEKGLPINEIIKELKLENRGSIYSNIDKIIHKKAWVKISNKYNIDYNKYHYKTYSYDDIFLMCKYLFTDKMKNKDIVKLFPEYDSKKLSIMIKSLKAKRIYKKVIYDYERSTTIENKK